MTELTLPSETSIHIRAIDWALSKGYVMSVTDLCCSIFNDDPEDDEWDVKDSTDRAEIIAAVEATDIPNVHIYAKPEFNGGHITTFSVIDEGVPDETINDYTVPRDGGSEFDDWYHKACEDY